MLAAFLHITVPFCGPVIPFRLFRRLTSWISFRQQVQVNLCSDRRKRPDNFTSRGAVLTGAATIERGETSVLKFCARGRDIDIKYCGEIAGIVCQSRFPLRRGSAPPINGAGSLVYYVRNNIITITTTLLRSLYRARRVLNSRGVPSESSHPLSSRLPLPRAVFTSATVQPSPVLSCPRPVLPPSSRALSPDHLQTRQT